ncbi:MAG TPA: lysylphosphatidylglycerol synthase transmembrane domain-containing protein [Puia sp.]|nr:lysylphosphatidylglycerol synthase transmembrane domain-containing protein [Puia sp.]
MNKKLLTIIQYVFFAALAAFFVWLSLRGLDRKGWQQLKDALNRAHYWVLIPVLFFLLLSNWLRALRWKQLIEPMGYSPSRLNCFFGVLIGYFVNLGAPRLGEVMKCTVLARYEKVPAEKLVGTIVAERAFDVICLATVFGLAFIFQFDILQSLASKYILPAFQNANGKTSYQKIMLLAGAAIILILLAKFFLNRFGHINIVQKIKNILIGVWHGLTSVKDVKNKPLFFVYTVMIWALYLVSTWCGFFAINETSSLTMSDALTVLAMGSVGMIVSPGGIGLYPLLVQETVTFYNVPTDPPIGQALGWLLWFGQFMNFIIFGVASFILLPRINKKRNEEPADNTAKNS